MASSDTKDLRLRRPIFEPELEILVSEQLEVRILRVLLRRIREILDPTPQQGLACKARMLTT